MDMLLLLNDWQQQREFTIDGELEAGIISRLPLHPGTAVRIFTGAPVPKGTDTVVMQEKIAHSK